MCRRVLHPLVRILVRFGISAGDLKSIVDSVYALAASEYLAGQGERVTYSKLAVVTGINRTFLPAILAAPQDDFRPRSNVQVHRAARVLNGWYEDRLFQTRVGEPAVLKVDGGSGSFRQLAERYSGGVYHQTLLSELERTGAVKRIGQDRVKALRRTPVAGGPDIDSVYATGEIAGDLLITLEHNLTAPEEDQLPVRMLVNSADAASLPLFRAQLGKRADSVMEAVELFTHSHAPRPDADGTDTGVEVGAAVFAIRRPLQTPQAPKLPTDRRGRPRKQRKP
jgi:hypothetical protein